MTGRTKFRLLVRRQQPCQETAMIKKEDIVYFDQLGFGWAVDARRVTNIFSGKNQPEHISDSILFERVNQNSRPRW